jgi:hypothetical protein
MNSVYGLGELAYVRLIQISKSGMPSTDIRHNNPFSAMNKLALIYCVRRGHFLLCSTL